MMQREKSTGPPLTRRACLAGGVAVLLTGCGVAGGVAGDVADGVADVDTPPHDGRIVSLSPAATSLLLGMGHGPGPGGSSRLSGVSHYDVEPVVADLPRVGDFLTIDWERLATLRPTVLVLQGRADRLPAGLLGRCERLKIRPVPLQIDRLEDVRRAIVTLRDVVGTGGAEDPLEAFDRRVVAVRQSVTPQPPPRVLLVLNESGTFVAGPQTFLDDVLTLAGGVNTLDRRHSGYPQLDREALAAAMPDVVLQLLPGASEVVMREAKRLATRYPRWPASVASRIHASNDPHLLIPGWRAPQTLGTFRDLLTGDAE